jgi:hypothetical protein
MNMTVVPSPTSTSTNQRTRGDAAGGVPEEAGTEEVHAAQRQETAEDEDLGNQHGPVAHPVQRPGSTDMQWNEKANPVTTLATAPSAMGEKRFSTETLSDPPARRRADQDEEREILARRHAERGPGTHPKRRGQLWPQ